MSGVVELKAGWTVYQLYNEIQGGLEEVAGEPRTIRVTYVVVDQFGIDVFSEDSVDSKQTEAVKMGKVLPVGRLPAKEFATDRLTSMRVAQQVQRVEDCGLELVRDTLLQHPAATPTPCRNMRRASRVHPQTVQTLSLLDHTQTPPKKRAGKSLQERTGRRRLEDPQQSGQPFPVVVPLSAISVGDAVASELRTIRPTSVVPCNMEDPPLESIIVGGSRRVVDEIGEAIYDTADEAEADMVDGTRKTKASLQLIKDSQRHQQAGKASTMTEACMPDQIVADLPPGVTFDPRNPAGRQIIVRSGSKYLGCFGSVESATMCRVAWQRRTRRTGGTRKAAKQW
jgi:hypothetical protein